MTHPASDRLCPRRDDVVAHFLDGDPDVRTVAAREELDEHRNECADCREALARARRLDALVASVGREPIGSSEDVDRWLDRALTVAEPVERSNDAAPRRKARLAAAAALLFVLGVAVGVALSGRGVQPESVPEVAEVEDVPEEPLPDGAIPLPDRPGPRRSASRRARPDAATHAAVVESPWTEVLAFPLAWTRDGWFGVTPGRAHRLATAARRDASQWLARALETGASELLVDLAVRIDDPERLSVVRETLLDSARCEAVLVRGVRAGADAHVAAAARVGGPRVDRALVSLADGELGASLEIAALVRCASWRPDRAEVLLELWRALEARGHVDDALAFAARLFDGLGDADALDLCAVLAASRNGPERARCLLALAAIGSPAASEPLARLLEDANREDAVLAAYALGRVRPGVDALDAWRPDRQGRALWLTALAARGEVRARREIARMSVSAEERAFLLEGGFSPGQVRIAARLFRERGTRAD